MGGLHGMCITHVSMVLCALLLRELSNTRPVPLPPGAQRQPMSTGAMP